MKRADALRPAFIETAARMVDSQLSPGKSGNFSLRTPSGMLITPTGIAWHELVATDVVDVGADGAVCPGQRLPSSEWQLHRAIYLARPDVHAIVHAHSLHATALACLHRSMPAFHYMVAEFGGDRVECSAYATYGSEALAGLAVKALGSRHACLMANHGAVTVGRNLPQAFDRALSLEALAAQYCAALQLGKPKILAAAEMKRVIATFRSYGMQSDAGAR